MYKEKNMDIEKVFSEIENCESTDKIKRKLVTIIDTAREKGLSYKEIFAIFEKNGYKKSFATMKKDYKDF